jgi:hypothetical protein
LRAFARLFVVFVLALSGWLLPVNGYAATGGDEKPAPEMDFILVQNYGCTTDCAPWISAEGEITPRTPARLKKLLSTLGDQKPAILFYSRGGDIDASYAIGRMIRKKGLTSGIGGTRLTGCPERDLRCKEGIASEGVSSGSAYAEGTFCVSACPLALSGGVARLSADPLSIGVHQITTTTTTVHTTYQIEYKTINGKKRAVSRHETGHSSRTTTTTKLSKRIRSELEAYLKEMQVDRALIALMLSTKPDDMYYLSFEEAMHLGVITDVLGLGETPGRRICGPEEPPEARCHRQFWTMKNGEFTNTASAGD